MNSTDNKLMEIREYKVVKSNNLIQKSRFHLSLQSQKIILYLISKIKPADMELKEHIFNIADFCHVCGLQADSGTNYKNIKNTLKELRDKSIWIELENGAETTVAWISSVTMNKNSGIVRVKLDDKMKPYLLQLQNKFTEYELLYTLAMKSQYSIRTYELLKSYEYQHKKTFDIDEFKKLISAEKYTRFPDFKRYVLDTALKEINELSDLVIVCEAIKESRRYAKLSFSINIKKDMNDRLKAWKSIKNILDSQEQMNLFDMIEDTKGEKQ